MNAAKYLVTGLLTLILLPPVMVVFVLLMAWMVPTILMALVAHIAWHRGNLRAAWSGLQDGWPIALENLFPFFQDRR